MRQCGRLGRADRAGYGCSASAFAAIMPALRAMLVELEVLQSRFWLRHLYRDFRKRSPLRPRRCRWASTSTIRTLKDVCRAPNTCSERARTLAKRSSTSGGLHSPAACDRRMIARLRADDHPGYASRASRSFASASARTIRAVRVHILQTCWHRFKSLIELLAVMHDSRRSPRSDGSACALASAFTWFL